VFLALAAQSWQQSVATDLMLFKETRSLMSTSVEIQILTSSSEKASNAFNSAFREIERLEDLLSRYKSTSQIAQIARQAGIAPVTVEQDLLTVLKEAMTIARLSHGAFDITCPPLLQVWQQKTAEQVPTDQELEQARTLVDYRTIQCDTIAQTVFLPVKGMSLDLGGIAKGYAVDRAVAVLRKQGIGSGIVNAGGDLFAFGLKGHTPWTTALRHPRIKDQTIATFSIQDEAVVTSGDYERFITIKGKRYAHIIDPRTGYPVENMMSVTVFAPSTMRADALATAVFVLGPEQGLALINSLDNTEAMIIDEQGRFFRSRGISIPQVPPTSNR